MNNIEGRNPVLEAIKSGRRIDKLYIKRGEIGGSLIKIVSMAKDKGITVVEVDRHKLDAMSETKAHQGVIAAVPDYDYASVEDILNLASERGEKPFVVICDRIEDPHNLGSIIRTANAAGAHGVIISKHGSVGLSASVAKASAGAVEYTKVAKVTNLTQTIKKLKDEGLWVAGADLNGTRSLFESDLSGSIALVIGSEGSGISRLVREECDFLIKIPMAGQIESLNASVAAALLMYEVMRTRQE